MDRMRNSLASGLINRLGIVLLAFLAGCAVDQSGRGGNVRPGLAAESGGDAATDTFHSSADIYRNLVLRAVRAQLGKPYRWGGQSPAKGFDCSGLVFFIHRKAGLKVPRVSRSQLAASKRVSIRNIQPGDLVFFRIGANVSHVGIYMGADRFVHAPSRGGRVNIESLKTDYWHERLVAAGNFYR